MRLVTAPIYLGRTVCCYKMTQHQQRESIKASLHSSDLPHYLLDCLSLHLAGFRLRTCFWNVVELERMWFGSAKRLCVSLKYSNGSKNDGYVVSCSLGKQFFKISGWTGALLLFLSSKVLFLFPWSSNVPRFHVGVVKCVFLCGSSSWFHKGNL